MGNAIKLVSGFVLFLIGLLIAYETLIYNLMGILLFVSIIICIVGLIFIISYFFDSNADRITNMIKEFFESNENISSLGALERNNNANNGPLRVKRDLNGQNNVDYSRFLADDYSEDFYEDSYSNSSEDLLNVEGIENDNVNFDNPLEFTPPYSKPLKVTRSPKKRDSDIFRDIPDLVVESDRSKDIKRALSNEDIVVEHDIDTRTEVPQDVALNRDIKIDINNPESLPVPKSLNSFVVSNNGLLTSKEAFENLAIQVNKDIMLEIPSLKDLSDRVLSHVPTIYSRVIIDEFDVSDMSYMFLITSLLKQGVHIKTVPKVHSTNLIMDDSYAMIILEGKDNMECGAIYEDMSSISKIRADFEKVWGMASNLDDNILVNNVGSGVV